MKMIVKTTAEAGKILQLGQNVSVLKGLHRHAVVHVIHVHDFQNIRFSFGIINSADKSVEL